MKYIMILLVLVSTALLSAPCYSGEKPEVYIRTAKGEIKILKNGDYVIEYNKMKTVFKKVNTFIWFNNNPYFELDDGRILKWNIVLSDNAFNLQKVWDKLYFVKQHSSGAEWEETSINIIDQSGNIKQLMMKKNGDIPLNTENYGVFYDKYFVEDAIAGFCVTDANGTALACYPWPANGL